MYDNNNMESKEISIERYFVNKASFARNLDFYGDTKQFKISPRFYRQITKDSEELYTVTIGVNIDGKAEETPLPFCVEVEVGGVFRLTNISEEEKKKALCANASFILFPYIRAIVSSIMSVSGVSPIILPVMNVNRLFAEQEKED